ncbi:toprim domain-containing protein [Legionella sp. CNM-4043-24]|uniref:toprim domain-containing protein n=1 Tax=Legionella sp. CNM-4043-24 TaxID=3421646 RepID=UPI00403AC450
MKNNRTGVELKWKSKGYTLNAEQKQRLTTEAMDKLKQRTERLAKLQQETALTLQLKLDTLLPIRSKTPYLKSKQIPVFSGVYTNKEGTTTYVPAMDKDGKIWSMQYITENGTKRFAKNSRKEGCFHVVGGFDSLASAPVIVIAEGYATAATLKEALDMPTVSAFDAGNLKLVAQELKAKFPHKPILIAGDDDKGLEVTQGVNPGKDMAMEACGKVNGFIVFPVFAAGEQELAPKRFSDFNDLANNSALGLEGVKRQVEPIVDGLVHRYRRTQQQNSTEFQLSNSM